MFQERRKSGSNDGKWVWEEAEWVNATVYKGRHESKKMQWNILNEMEMSVH